MKEEAIEALVGLRAELVVRDGGGMKPMIQTWSSCRPSRRSRSWWPFAQPGRFALELDVYMLFLGGLALLQW